MARKNIVLMISDGHQTGVLGCYGNPVVQTPYIDALAKQGVFFQHCSTSSPLCRSANISLWTGLLPHKCQMMEGNRSLMKPEVPGQSLIHLFGRAGYHTVYAGKWNLVESSPADFGFLDQAIIPEAEYAQDRGGRLGETYRNYVTKLGYQLADRPGTNAMLTERDISFLSQSGKAPCGTSEIPLKHYQEPWTTQQAIQALERRPPEKPFWAVISYRAPHFPLIVPEPYDRLYPPESVPFPPNFQPARVNQSRGVPLNEEEWHRLIAHYWGFCSLIDAQVGTLIYYLEENNLLAETIIIYTSERGAMMGAHGMYEHHGNLHYEEVINVPFVLVHPEYPGGREIQESVTLMDLIPTLAEWMKIPLENNIDGVSFAPSFPDVVQNESREVIFVETLNTPDHRHPETDNVTISMWTHHEKYIFHWFDGDELYDLASDPYEMFNLWNTDPSIHTKVKPLQARMIQEIMPDAPAFGQKLKKRMEEKSTTR